MDAIPSAIGASETSGFCDFYYQTNASVVVARSQYNSLVTGGIAYILANCANSITRGNYTSRLAYRGEYDIFDLDYVPAPYFEFDGTNYLDTGFIPNQDTRVTMDAQATITPENSIFYCWFGARTTTLYFDMYKASTGLSVMGFYGPNYTPFTIDWSARHILEINKNSVSIDSTVKTLATSTFNIGYPLYLGACDDTGVAESPLAMRLYSCKVYDNGTLVRDYVPMKRKRDEKVFLYDKVNNSFVTPTSI